MHAGAAGAHPLAQDEGGRGETAREGGNRGVGAAHARAAPILQVGQPELSPFTVGRQRGPITKRETGNENVVNLVQRSQSVHHARKHTIQLLPCWQCTAGPELNSCIIGGLVNRRFCLLRCLHRGETLLKKCSSKLQNIAWGVKRRKLGSSGGLSKFVGEGLFIWALWPSGTTL